MPGSEPKSPATLPKADLVRLAERLQALLYWDPDAKDWDPDKEWDSGTIEHVAEVLADYDLVPKDG